MDVCFDISIDAESRLRKTFVDEVDEFESCAARDSVGSTDDDLVKDGRITLLHQRFRTKLQRGLSSLGTIMSHLLKQSVGTYLV